MASSSCYRALSARRTASRSHALRSFLIRAYPGLCASSTLPPDTFQGHGILMTIKSVGTDAVTGHPICMHANVAHTVCDDPPYGSDGVQKPSRLCMKFITSRMSWNSLCDGKMLNDKHSKPVGNIQRKQQVSFNVCPHQRHRTHIQQPTISYLHQKRAPLKCMVFMPPSRYCYALYHSSSVSTAGHNKWSKVKHKKKFTDREKSKNIHKFVTQIVSAIKTGGGSDPESNIRLASVIGTAKKTGIPKANIENAIKIGSNKGAASSTELVVYEGQGPSGYHMMIEAFTDNNRKTRPEIKNLLAKYSGILGESGSSAFMFDHKGIVRVPENQIEVSTDILEVAIEAGAEDVHRVSSILSDELSPDSSADSEHVDSLEEQYVKFICNPSELTKVSEALKSLGYTIASASLEYLPRSLVSLNRESYENALKLLDALSEHSTVTEVYDNFTLAQETTEL